MSTTVYSLVEAGKPTLPRTAAGLAAAVRSLGEPGARSVALVAGPHAQTVAAQAATLFDAVYWTAVQTDVPEHCAAALLALVRAQMTEPSFVCAMQTGCGLDAAAAVAADFELAILTDVGSMSGSGAEREITVRKLGGAVTSRLSISLELPLVLVWSLGEHAPAEAGGAGTVEEVPLPALSSPVERLACSNLQQDEISFDVADTIVSGGKGLGGPEPFTGIVRELATVLGAAVGASRAVVDAGWVPHAMQIGQTGRTVAPKLYIALGISGQIQHRVGMQTAGTIVAINTDAKAPIAQFSDLLVVGDLHSIVPALTRLLKEEKVHT